ncbi:MAG: TetR/AcrR family transcriptional regulator [Acidobacteriota bacterium]
MPEEEAIDRALRLFWKQGYDRTSVADLSSALGVGPSSLYNAFGSKQNLFRRAIEHYASTYTSFIDHALEGDLDVEPAIRGLLREAAAVYASPDSPPGCAVMQSAGAASPGDSEAAAITLEVKAEVERQIAVLIEKASRNHGTRLSASPRLLAKYLNGTLRGLSQLVIDGVAVSDLMQICDVASAACVAVDGPTDPAPTSSSSEGAMRETVQEVEDT